ncbi:hypothetical protein RJ60_05925, partial [Mesotoga sp. B105.6.4]
MIVITYTVIVCLILLVTKMRFGSFFRLNSLFTVIWCTTGSLSSMGLFDLFAPSLIIHLYCICILIIFNLVYLILSNNITKISTETSVEEQYPLNKQKLCFIFLLNALSWIFMAKFVRRSIELIAYGGLKYLRLFSYDPNMELGTTAELTIVQAIVEPVFTATILITVIYTIKNRRNFYLTFMSLID